MFSNPALDRTLQLGTSSLLSDAVRSFGRYHRHRREYKRLLAMPDYLLADIGLTRSEIADALRQRYF